MPAHVNFAQREQGEDEEETRKPIDDTNSRGAFTLRRRHGQVNGVR
jgi:hypothetical protein